jgi:hypothetical protein
MADKTLASPVWDGLKDIYRPSTRWRWTELNSVSILSARSPASQGTLKRVESLDVTMRGLLMVGVLLVSASGGAQATTLAILPVKLLDTSYEVRDQRDAHAARLATMDENLRDALAVPGGFQTVTLITTQDVAEGCVPETPECLVKLARAQGADRALFAVVHKSSSLIMQLFAQVVDVDTEKVVARQELSFRGDTDESWHRAGAFLARELSK